MPCTSLANPVQGKWLDLSGCFSWGLPARSGTWEGQPKAKAALEGTALWWPRLALWCSPQDGQNYRGGITEVDPGGTVQFSHFTDEQDESQW